MARPIRVEFEDAVYHITARGNERRRVFHTDAERALFLDTLAECVGLHHLRVHAWCLMPNHYHLVISTPRRNLSQAIGWFQTTFTIRYNRRRRSGPLFQGRFKAHLVDADQYAMTLLRYVHLNPVRPRDRTQAIPAERRDALAAFRWSSHRAYAGWEEPPPWLSLEWLLFFGGEIRRAQRAYRRFVDEAFGQVVSSPWEALRGGLVLGGEALWQKARKLIGARTGAGELRWPRRARGEEELRKAARKLAANEEDRRIQIWLRVMLGGERRSVIAAEYGYADPSAVTQMLKRLEVARIAQAPLDARLTIPKHACQMSKPDPVCGYPDPVCGYPQTSR